MTMQVNSFRLSPEMRREILALAETLDLSYSEVIRWLLLEGLGIVKRRGTN